jgi:hypothetical protein
VRASDALGNLGPVFTRSFTLDTISPTTVITAPNPPLSIDQCPNTTGVQVFIGSPIEFEFASDDPSATFRCWLDLDFTMGFPCTSPYVYDSRLNEGGMRNFTVQARDAAGNATPVAPGRGWTYVASCP